MEETDEEKSLRLKEEKENEDVTEFWNWYSFVYTLADGQFVNMEKVFEQKIRLALTHKLFELRHKKIAEYYAFGRYNIGR